MCGGGGRGGQHGPASASPRRPRSARDVSCRSPHSTWTWLIFSPIIILIKEASWENQGSDSHLPQMAQIICMRAYSVTQSCPTLCDLTDCGPPGSTVHGISQARKLELSCHFLLQGMVLTQGSNSHLLHWQAGSLPLRHLRSLPEITWRQIKEQHPPKSVSPLRLIPLHGL